jgi:hypothetical protein
MGNEAPQTQSPTPASATTAPAQSLDFSAVPGHQIEDQSTMQAAPKSVLQAGPGGVAHAKGAGAQSGDLDITGSLNKLTEPIENYTPAGRAEHPILSKLGDVTRNVKEMLEGGQAAGKPMGTSSSPIMDTANTLGMAEDAAEYAPKVEAFVGEHAAPIASHIAETGRNFLTSLAEEGKAALEATHPEGSLEAGFAKIPGHKSEGPAPELPKKPTQKVTPKSIKKPTPPVEVNPASDATAKAEADLAAARQGYAADMEKNPTSFRKGTPVHEQVVNVDPNKVAQSVNPGGNTFDEPTVQKYQQKIRAGEDIPAARIEYGLNGETRGFDGRHRVEASRREGVPVKLWTRREMLPGEAPPTDIGYEEPTVHELSGDEEPTPVHETAPEEEEGAYHPDLQKLVDKYGATDNAEKTANGASFIAPDGKFVHVPAGGTHDSAIDWVGAGDGSKDPRPEFIKNTGVIRTRARFGRGGHELSISVPEQGVTHDQIDALKQTARATLGSGKSGHIVMEVAKADGAHDTAEFANANNIEPMLRKIGAHPDKETPVDATPWNEKAAQLHEQNGGFTINPRTGAVPASGHVVEAVPEARQVSDTPNTPEQIQKFADKNKKLLAKNPELHIGGYTNDAGKHELNLSAVTHDSAKAEKVAKALDQESYYNVGEGKVVPTGGKNVQQEFPDYNVAQRLRDLAPEEPGNTISTRQPSSVKYSTEDPLRHNLRLTGDLINKNPELADKWAETVRNYPGFKAPEGADTQTTLNAFIEHAKDNLKHLYNSLPVEDQEKNKVWYDGAHTLTKELADKHGLTHPQAAGVVAALSPQKDWDQNVSLARRLTDIVKNQQDTVAGPNMLAKAKEIREASKTVKNPNANKYLVELAKSIQGKKLSELSDVDKKAAFVRLHDEVNNPREYFKINPDGSNAGVYKKADGTNGQVAWGSLNEIGKAIDILGDGSRESLSNNLGQAHKVRHFYNNIIEPNSARGDVTVDTHAVAAALMRPLGGKEPEVLANFGGPGSNIHGLNGTYPLYHEAYTRAAKELDIAHPRQLQSVVWDHIRNQFPAEFKTKENQDAINSIWKEAQNGKITAEDARKQILEYAQGHRVTADEGVQRPADQTELFGHGVHGEPTGGNGRGDRSEYSVGNQAERPTTEPVAEVKPPAKIAETNRSAGGDWAKILAEGDAKAKAARLKKK